MPYPKRRRLVGRTPAELPKFFGALPAYLGGKRRLCPLIFASLAEVLPRDRWRSSVLLDPFSGGGAVSLYAKAQGFSVLASDLSDRAAVVTRAIIANSTTRLRPEDVLDLFRTPPGDYPHVAAAHSPGVFSAEAARWLDRALAQAGRRAEPMRSLLQLLVIKLALRCQPMSMLRGTDAAAAVTGDLDRVSPSRLGHYLRAQGLFQFDPVWRVAQEINAGVFGGSAAARQGDALAIIAGTDADLLYLDPPYPGTTSYEREYAVLDAMLGAAQLNAQMPSLEALLGASQHIPFLVLSYGGPRYSLAEVKGAVAKHRRVAVALALPYSHLTSINKEKKSNEYLIIAAA